MARTKYRTTIYFPNEDIWKLFSERLRKERISLSYFIRRLLEKLMINDPRVVELLSEIKAERQN